MCGITGFIDLKRQTSGPELQALARRMADSMVHRGPDDSGTWADLLADVQELTIILDAVNGDDIQGLDNLRLAAAPLPAPVATPVPAPFLLLGCALGLLGVMRRRQTD